MPKKSYILVTGGAGYIGSHMVRYLMEYGEEAVVFDNLSTGYRDIVPDNIAFFKGDIRRESDLDSFFKTYNIQYVMHFAAKSVVPESIEKPLDYYENNILGCLNLIKKCLQNSVKGFIFSSTAAVYGEPERVPIKESDALVPVTPYGYSKMVCERMLLEAARRHAFPVVILRYFNAAGAHKSADIGEMHPNETHLIPNVMDVALGVKKELFLFGDDYPTPDRTCIRDFIYIGDLCRAHYLALDFIRNTRISDVFNLGTGKCFSVKEIIKFFKK